MTQLKLASAGGLAAALLAIAAGQCAAQESPTAVGLDTKPTVGGVAVGCSGVGQAKAEPRWLAYPIRVEFADPARDYLANGAVSVSDASGHVLAAVSCDGPWILLRPAGAGAYKVKGWLP